MKRRNNFVSSLLVFLAVALVITSTNLTAFAVGDVLDGVDTKETKKEKETETLGSSLVDEEKNLIKITNEKELAEISKKVNEGDRMAAKTVQLENDILLIGKWKPIGADPMNPFCGTFNGQNYTISGLKVEAGVNGGLFGYIQDAKITNLNLEIMEEGNSTAGLFFSATRSSISGTTYKLTGEALAVAFAMPMGARSISIWDGTATYDWYNSASGREYTISSASDLAGFTQIMAGNYSRYTASVPPPPSPADETPPQTTTIEHFQGATIILDTDIDLDGTDWLPIGSYGTDETDQRPFMGRFIGNGHTISNMTVNDEEGGLFKYTHLADITDLTLNEPKIYASDFRTGALISYANGTNISYINVINPVINAEKAAGIVDAFFHTRGRYPYAWGNSGYADGYDSNKREYENDERGTSIENCFVYNPNLTGGYKTAEGEIGAASGIVNYFNGYGIAQCGVYGGTITGSQATAIANNIYGVDGAYAVVTENIVLGTVLNGVNKASGIATETYQAKDSAGDLMTYPYNGINSNIISDVTGSSVLNLLFSGEEIFGLEHNFIDSSSGAPLFPTGATIPNYMRENIWDDISPRPFETDTTKSFGNKGLSTEYLTQAGWVPNPQSWEAVKGYYPRLSSTTTSSNEYLRTTGDLASLPVSPVDPLERYTGGARGIKLMEKTGDGHPITWAGIPVYLEEDTKAGVPGVYKAFVSKTNGKHQKFNLTATVSPYGVPFVKHFDDIIVIDNLIEELVDDHIPKEGDMLDVTENTFTRVFKDSIETSPEVLGAVELQVLNKNDGKYYTEQSVICNNALDKRFVIHPDGKRVSVKFELREGEQYLLVYPEKMVQEAPDHPDYPKKNYSDERSIAFSTQRDGAPQIALKKPIWEGSTDKMLTLKELLDSFTIYEFENGEVLYSAEKTGDLVQYTGVWNDKDPIASMNQVLDNATGPALFYHLDKTQVTGNNPEAGNARLYVMAKNSSQKTDRKIINISILGVPQWVGTPPDPFVHMSWTNNIESVVSAAKQGASAVVETNDKNTIPSAIGYSYNEKAWESVTDRRTPGSITITVYAINQKGEESTTKRDVVVYLDCPIAWTITPSPMTLSFTTKENLEKEMNVVARNFSKDDIIYDHWIADKFFAEEKYGWENAYREPGTYYVDVSSVPQDVTKCPNDRKTCTHRGVHPTDMVEDDFVVNITYPPGSEITSYWGKMAKEAGKGADSPQSTYSKAFVDKAPTSYNMPRFALDYLALQRYGKIHLEFADTYRWKLYSDTLDTSYRWGDIYSLEVNTVTDPNVTKLVGSLGEGVQFRFDHAGPLFGEVMFDLNLNTLSPIYENLPKKDLGLYAYNKDTDSLDLVSDVIVTEDNWASATLTQALPTTYVLKAGKADDILEPPVADISTYYLSTKVEGEYGDWKETAEISPLAAINYKNLEEITSLIVEEKTAVKLAETENLKNNLWIGLAVLAVVGGVGALLYYKKKRGVK